MKSDILCENISGEYCLYTKYTNSNMDPTSNIICKWTETNGDNFYFQLFVSIGSVEQDATVQKI